MVWSDNLHKDFNVIQRTLQILIYRFNVKICLKIHRDFLIKSEYEVCTENIMTK